MTRESITKLQELSSEHSRVSEVASEQLKTAQDRGYENKHKVVRNGKEVELTERVLWDEVFYLGAECEAGKLLQGIYPEVFKSFKIQNKLADDLNSFTYKEFGVSANKMRVADFIRLAEEMFTLLIDEKVKSTDSVAVSE